MKMAKKSCTILGIQMGLTDGLSAEDGGRSLAPSGVSAKSTQARGGVLISQRYALTLAGITQEITFTLSHSESTLWASLRMKKR